MVIIGSDSDSEDELPPLEDSSGKLRQLDLTDLEKPPEDKTAVPDLKKGFLDTKPSKPKAKPDPNMTTLVGDKSRMGKGAKQIPDFMKVEQDPAVVQQEKLKKGLIDAMKPTPDMMKSVTADPTIMEGFDDPEVMAAVSAIADDPNNFNKYRNNPKVIKFYEAMGGMMGNKLEQMGMQAPSPTTAAPAPPAAPDVLTKSIPDEPLIQVRGGTAGGLQVVNDAPDSDSDEDMAEIARSLASNPFSRRKPSTVPPPMKVPPKAAAAPPAPTPSSSSSSCSKTDDATPLITAKPQTKPIISILEPETKPTPSKAKQAARASSTQEVLLKPVYDEPLLVETSKRRVTPAPAAPVPDPVPAAATAAPAASMDLFDLD